MSAEPTPRRATTAAAFLVGLPLAAAFLALVHYGPLRGTPLERYLKHGVECVEVVMFCLAAGALAAKLRGHLREDTALRAEVLPPWDGRPVPVAEASRLLGALSRLPARLQGTVLVSRVASALDFLARRGSAADLDDQMRDLADADRDALEGSYALIRFITWAIPILGFLGTVLGITGAIAGVTPERLEQDLNSVTDGLALAFDSTALALGLTMLTMFLTYLVERLEEGVLESVDRYAARHLAHRFERTGAEANQVLQAVRESTVVLHEATRELVRGQAEVWAKALAEGDRRRAEAEARHQERFAAALEAALSGTLRGHAEAAAALEGRLSAAVAALARTAEGVNNQAAALAKLHEGEAQLARLQESLARNLEALTATGTLEEAVHSLTAAAHLLTARVAPSAKRPGVAA